MRRIRAPRQPKTEAIKKWAIAITAAIGVGHAMCELITSLIKLIKGGK